jgi:SAM-dependent methyltransferase
MDLAIAQFLLSPSGRAALDELAADSAVLSQAHQLATLSRLRRRFAPQEAAGLLEVATARHRASQQAKFSRAGEMFFTKTGLEQASGELIASYRAARFARVLPPGRRIADLGCGIGGDSMALARHFHVTGVDLDAARLLFAQANAAALDLSENFEPLQADLTSFDPAPYAGLFFDPARRTSEGRRLFSVEDYTPPLSIIKKWLAKVPNIAVKISPGVNYAELEGYDCEVEIISENGDVKEAVLWFGDLREKIEYRRSKIEDQDLVRRRATLLPTGDTLIDQPGQPEVESGEPLAYLYEPDGAVIRAGLVEELAHRLNARKIDPTIAFLTASHLVETPFARTYRIIESLPFNLKKLNQRLNALAAGRVTVKKRGSPIEPQELERALKLKGPKENEIIVVLTHVMGTHWALIVEK